MDIKEKDILEAADSHWYYVSKGAALCDYLRGIRVGEVLDVGAGSGAFSRKLLDAGICTSALCVDPADLHERTEMQNGKTITFARSASNVTQKLIVMMDVLEHVDDDVALLRHYTESMPGDAHVLITVPAFQSLWSGHDVFLEHRRRYTLPMLERVVNEAGLEVIRSHYFFALLFPAVALIRLVKKLLLKTHLAEPRSDLALLPGWLNRLLITLHAAERRIIFPANRLAGVTLFCLCRKAA